MRSTNPQGLRSAASGARAWQSGSAQNVGNQLNRMARRYGRKFKRKYDLDVAGARSRVLGSIGYSPSQEQDTDVGN